MTARGIQIGFVVYWLAFVLFTVHQGQYPVIFEPDVLSYPYWEVAWICLQLTLLLAVLYLIVPAARFRTLDFVWASPLRTPQLCCSVAASCLVTQTNQPTSTSRSSSPRLLSLV